MRLTLICLLGAALLSQVGASKTPDYEVFAVRFAHVPYALSSLVAGAERGPRVDIAFTIWPIRDRASGRVILVDAGFHRDKFLQQWKPQDYVRPSDALQALGITPDAVTDVILTHSHWDHADGADLFPKAAIWIQKDEYSHYIGEQGQVLNRGGVDADDAAMLAALKAAGRVRLVDGDDQEIAPGIRVYTGGKHTFQSQYVGVRTAAGIVVLASDNAYLYMNLDKRLAIAQTVDAASNVAAQSRMKTLAGDTGVVIPGHDPDVFRRFPAVASNVVRIAPR
ncbi:MAG TPA: N-acyl homoserine lactonase family protein [Vicinamibacterales bacterium]|nr:N-acyl homoserine lactonase family protein [Vicinamibacterales bacterium]